ncbi:hypothetical protein Tco_1489620 [Tanacetum coccineum]
MRLSIRSWVIEWKGLPLLLLAEKQSRTVYALTENPTIYTSLIQQFWETAFACTSENEEMELIATIDGRVKTITQASIRRHLKLEDADGIDSLPNTEIFEQHALMGYASDSDKLIF